MSDTVWIKTTPALDGSGYVVTLEADDDTARVLTPTEALAYAAGVLAAASRCEYDAAVIRQMTRALKLPVATAAQVITDLRADRPPLDPSATAPMWLEPGVNKDLDGFLVISINGKKVGQWNATDARGHALAVIESIAVADLDSAYVRVLVGSVGIDKARALQVVDDLGNHRDEATA
jgi:hypothetical protein